MNLLFVSFLLVQQPLSDEQLRAIVDRFDQMKGVDRESGPASPWYQAHRAGPAILKHVAAVFPGKSEGRNVKCGNCGWQAEGEYPLVRLMLSFGEPALPHLLRLVKDPDASRARIAAAVLCRFHGKEVVASLLEFADRHELSKDPDVERHVSESLGQETFLKFGSRRDLAEWFGTARHKTQLEWLWEAIDHSDRERSNRDSTVKGIHRLLDPQGRLNALLKCFVDLGWREAGFALYTVTGHAWDTRGRHLWDDAILARERKAWDAFRNLGEKERQIEVALHTAGGERTSLPGRLMSHREAGDFLVDNAEEALDCLERISSDHPQCAGVFLASLRFVSTAKNWERVEKFAPTLKTPYIYIGQILEQSRHPSMADKMLDMVIAGAAESVIYRGLMTELPERVRPDMVPKLLDGIGRTTGRNKNTLLDALGRTADPRGWDILEKEIFNDLPNSAQAAAILEYWPGERAVAALRKLLKSTNWQGYPVAARILADRGDYSGVPALIERLQSLNVDIEKRWCVGALAAIRGQPIPRTGESSKPFDFGSLVQEYLDWWQENKERSRVDWLLDGLESGAGVLVHAANPLLFLAQEDLKDLSEFLTKEERLKETVERVRAWVARTGFTFNKDTVRVPYQSKASPR